MAKSNKNIEEIYLDYASATPIDQSVLVNLQKVLKKNYANPSAIHNSGVEAKKILEKARGDIMEILNIHNGELVFTSGATESNNLAIMGLINIKQQKIPHVVTTNIEHASVLEVCKHLEETKKIEVTYVGVEENGIVDPKKVKKALKLNTILVSVMYANNEIGTIQPISEIAKEIRHFNKINFTKILFHTDATQAINYLPIKVEKLGVDMMSFNGAKIYGPKGVGVLYIKKNAFFNKIMFGGDQEFGLRPGTENVALAFSLAEALKIVEKIKEKESKRTTLLRDYFFKKLIILGKNNFIVNGDLKNRLPNNINITIPKIPSDLLIIELSARGIMASAKSACKSGDSKVSHVIQAINKEAKDVDGSLRFSLGRETTKKDIDSTIKALSEILTKLKKWYN